MRPNYVIGAMRLKKAEPRWEINAEASKVPRQKRREANHEPFRQIERLKEDLLRQLKRFTKRFEDFDFRLGSIHGEHFESFIPERSSALCHRPAQTRNDRSLVQSLSNGCFRNQRPHVLERRC